MYTPKLAWEKLKKWMGKEASVAFVATLVIGVLTHLSILVSDIPNHDGLDSMYFDQNMIGSGRWFLGVACGITSFYSIPWLIGIIAIFYIAVTSVFLTKLLKLTSSFSIIIISGMLVAFPSIASNFAYAFTMDGYMIGLLLAVVAVYLVGVHKYGFIFGGIALAFSMGTYQAYLPVAMLLSLYLVLGICFSESETKVKLKASLNYVFMGVIGVALYYLLLKVLMVIENVELNTYQGINEITSTANVGLLYTLKKIYSDFVSFTIEGNILFANIYSLIATIILAVVTIYCATNYVLKKKLFKNLFFYCVVILSLIIVPVLTNSILIISPNVTYHLLMRYQWVVFGVLAVAFVDRYVSTYSSKIVTTIEWALLVSGVVIVFSYIVSDNIAYSNLQKKYEKTYSYCLRLADRIEQTEGYYQGIPIYMIGVVGDDAYPVTDITNDVTGHMIGMNGDYLLYTPNNYELFYKYYMGITFNFLRPDEANFYDEDWYVAMPSFPAKDSVKVVNGILVVKTENSDRTKVEK